MNIDVSYNSERFSQICGVYGEQFYVFFSLNETRCTRDSHGLFFNFKRKQILEVVQVKTDGVGANWKFLIVEASCSLR